MTCNKSTFTIYNYTNLDFQKMKRGSNDEYIAGKPLRLLEIYVGSVFF